MKLNAKQRAYLTSLGMAEDAGDVQVKAFTQTLGKAQTAFLGSLAEAEAPASPAPPAPPSPPTPAEPTPAPQASRPTPPAAPPAPPATPADDIQAQVQAASRAERQRCQHVRGVAQQLGLGESWAMQQIDGGFSVDQVNAAALTQAAANRPPVPIAGPRVEVGTDRHGAAVADALTDSFIQRIGGAMLQRDRYSGLPIVGQAREPHEWAGRFRGNSLDMARNYLTMCGRSTEGLSAPELARAAFLDCPRVPMVGAGGMHTSGDFPMILANAIGITLQQRYALYPVQWRKFAIEAPAGDFRTQTLVRHGELPVLPQVNEAGEYTYVSFGEEREQWLLTKRGHIVALSWEMVVNDQLNAFGRVLAMEGDAAARTDDTLAFAVLTGNPLMGDGVALFDTATHANNVAALSGAPPSIATYTAMILAMKTQAAPRRNAADAAVFIVADPRVIICPVALEATVDILNLAERNPAIDVPTGLNQPNLYRGRFTRASHPLLDAVATVGPTTWFGCTSPTENPAMILGYLDGMAGPQLTQESGFDQDVRKFKVMHCRAAKATDWRFWYRNVGY